MAVCLRYVGDRETAEDLLQEGFITLFSKLDSYSGTGSFEGWARKIFVNTALMHLRKTMPSNSPTTFPRPAASPTKWRCRTASWDTGSSSS